MILLTLVALGIVCAVNLVLTISLARRHLLLAESLSRQPRVPGVSAGLPVRAAAPSFALADAHGRTVSLGDRQGPGGATIAFLASGCTGCKQLLAQLSRAREALDERGLPLTIIVDGVPADPDSSVIALAADEARVPVLFATREESHVFTDYAIYAYPTVYTFDAGLRLVTEDRSLPTADSLAASAL